MISRRLIGHGLAALLLVLSAVGGCSNHPKPNPNDAKNGESASVPPGNGPGDGARTAAPDARGGSVGSSALTLDPPFSAPEALKRKTAAYSQQVESMIGSGGAPTAAPSNPATGPTIASRQAVQQSLQSRSQPALPPRSSQVQWGDPLALRLNHTTGGDSSGARTNASAQADPVQPISSWSNSPATIEPQKSEPLPPTSPPPAAAGSGDALALKIEKRVREYPRDISGHLDFQLLRFLQDERVPELNTISSLPSEDRELVAAVVDGLSNFRNGLRQDNNMLLSRKIRPLLEMSDRLRGEADLTIPTIALCTVVRTFGEYDPIDPPRFAAGRAHDVILYCEIENFSSQLDDKQMWLTKLTKDAVLYTENGMPVWSDKSETISDSARRRRHDFFIVKKLRLPDNLGVGRYLMKVTIHDQQVNRVAEATLPIIVAAESTAAAR